MKIDDPRYDESTGEKLSVTRKVTYGPADWLQFLTFGPQLGLVIREVVQLPEGWKNPPKELIKPE